MAEQEKNAPPVLQEISLPEVAGGGIAQRATTFTELLQPSDKVLLAKGGDYAIYQDVLRDDQVASTLQQRRAALIKCEWSVEPGGTDAAAIKAADALRENLDNIGWDRINRGMHYGIFYGYAVGECMWATDGKQIKLADVKVRKQSRFAWGNDGSLRLKTKANPKGEAMQANKMWVYRTGADNDDEPYGLGLAHFLYWPVWFKRNDLKFWLIFNEKFGMPTPAGKYPPGATKEEKDALLAAVSAVSTDAGIIFPSGMEITLLEAARSGAADYETMYAAMNDAISKIVLSQTMTTDDGASLSQAQVHNEVKDAVVKSDADLICESFNEGPARWLTAWNFGDAAPPKVTRRTEREPDLKPQADRDRILYEMGFKPKLDYVIKTYGDNFEPRTDMTAIAPGAAAPAGDIASFAEPRALAPPDALDKLRDEAAKEWQVAIDKMVEPVFKLLAECASFAEFTEKLPTVLPDMDPEQIADLLARSGFNARLAGALGAPIANTKA